ncbi:MAG: hypothetical protein M3Y57_00380 [Acidobacteriota bacterium]|nr:hypothetical protein [Acidobacteriota bacterium]
MMCRMGRLSFGVGILFLSSMCRAQDPAPDVAQQRAIRSAMAGYAEKYVSSLPNFLCELTTEQYQSGTKHPRWKRGDTVTVQLTFSNGKEKRLLEAVNDKPVKSPFVRLRSPLTTEGEFGAILADALADSSNAEFRWNRWDTIQDKKVAVFDYSIDKEHSLLKLGESDLASAIVAYHGSIFADPDSGAILKISDEADDIPAEIRMRSIGTTVDYEEVKIGTGDYVLPSHATVVENTRTELIRNELYFRNYRKFEAESSIKFETDAPQNPSH